MKRHLLFLSAAILSTTACNSEPETINAGGYDPQAEELAKAPPVELPPSITASRTYRCKDNSLVYVEFFSNNTALYKTQPQDAGTLLTAPAADQPFTAEGYSVSANAEQIQLTAPGKGSQSCKA